MSTDNYTLYVTYRPAEGSSNDPLQQRAFLAAKILGPCKKVGIPEDEARAYGFWVNQTDSDEVIKDSLFKMFSSIVKQYKEFRDG